MNIIDIISQFDIFPYVLIPSNGKFKEKGIVEKFGIIPGLSDEYVDPYTGLINILYRAQDIPALCDDYTGNGIPTIGITGEDLLRNYSIWNETNIRILSTAEWPDPGEFSRYRRPTLCVIALKGFTLSDLKDRDSIIVNSDYKNIALEEIKKIENKLGITLQVKERRGKTESMIGDLAPLGIELVWTGQSLIYKDKSRELKKDILLDVVYEIMESRVCVISSYEGDAK